MTDFGGAIKQADVYDFAVLGVPYDEKSSFLKGPAKGPRAIREASTSACINAWTESEVNLETDAVMVDLGDVDTGGGHDSVSARITERVAGIVMKGAVPIVLGGDHSISYPVLKGVAEKFGSLDILHFDAHPDLYDELYGDPYSHACPFSRILDDGLAEKLVQVGIRAATGEHRRKAEQFGVRMISMRDIEEAAELEFSNPLFISFDVDALDPAFAPGVSHHEPGGLSTRQALSILQNLRAQVIGMDVVEVNPDRDPLGITASAAVKIIIETAGKIVAERQEQGRGR